MPWFIGDMIDDEYKYGAVGTWGIYIPGRGLHRQHEVYATGFWDVVTFLVSSFSTIEHVLNLLLIVAQLPLHVVLCRAALEFKMRLTMVVHVQSGAWGVNRRHSLATLHGIVSNHWLVWLELFRLARFPVSNFVRLLLFILHLLQAIYFCTTVKLLSTTLPTSHRQYLNL